MTKLPMVPMCMLIGFCITASLCQDFSVDLRTGQSTVNGSGLVWLDRPSSGCSSTCNKQGLLKLTFNKSDRKRAEVKMWLENPTGWSFNIGDSRTNNGWAGDAGTQHHDAEVQGLNSQFAVYGKDVEGVTGVSYGLLYSDGTFLQGLKQITLNIKDMEVKGTNGDRSFYMDSCQKLYALNGQPDADGPVNYDVFFAMNRVVAGSYRSGSGLCRAEVTWHSE